MNGLVVLYDSSFWREVAKRDGTAPKGGCFARLFAPILESVGKLYWITLHYASSPFGNAMGGIENFDRVTSFLVYVEGVDSDLMMELWRPPLLEQLAEYVHNDYQTFLGIKRGLDPLEVTRQFAEIDERSDFGNDEWKVAFAAAIEEGVEIAFFADEGIWEMYAAECHLVDAVMEGFRKLGGGVVRVEPANLGNRHEVIWKLWQWARENPYDIP